MSSSVKVFACTDFSALLGKMIDAFFHADGYWRFFVALRTTADETLIFSTEEHALAKYFEVFPIKFAVEATEERNWILLDTPLCINSVASLWRAEWLEPDTDVGRRIGAGPHYIHRADAGPIPSEVVGAEVLAGVQLCEREGTCVIIAASDSVPFNVDITTAPAAMQEMLGRFCVGKSE